MKNKPFLVSERSRRSSPVCPARYLAHTLVCAPLLILLGSPGTLPAMAHSPSAAAKPAVAPAPSPTLKASPSPSVATADPGAAYLKATSDATASVKTAETAISAAAPISADIVKQTAAIAPDTTAAATLSTLTADVSSVTGKKLRENLDSAYTAAVGKTTAAGTLVTVLARLKATHDAIPAAPKPGADVVAAQNSYATLVNSVAAEQKSVAKARSDMHAALAGIDPAIVKTMAALAKPIAPLTVLSASADAGTLRAALAASLPQLTAAITTRSAIDSPLRKLTAAESALPISALTAYTTAWDGQIGGIVNKLQAWTEQITASSGALNIGALDSLKRFEQNSTGNALAAQTEVVLLQTAEADYNKIDAAEKALLAEFGTVGVVNPPAGGVINALASNESSLGVHIATTTTLTTALQATYPIDTSNWVSATVPLYYFDDVQRLMQILNNKFTTITPPGNLESNAQNAQTTLQQATVSLAQAQAAENNAQTALATQQAAVDTAQQALNKANAEFQVRNAAAFRRQQAATDQQAALQNKVNVDGAAVTTATSEQSIAQQRLATATTAQQAAQTALQTAQANAAATTPPTPASQAAVISAQHQLDVATRAETAANNQYMASQQRVIQLTQQQNIDQANLTQVTADDANAASPSTDPAVQQAQTNLTNAQSALSTVQSTLTTAQSNEQSANLQVVQSAGSALLEAQAANLSFAQARDNGTLFATSLDLSGKTPLSTDPLQRVLIYAFPDSKQIYLRGSAVDIDQVKQIIEGFDQPDGQAMMTLHVLEIDSDSSLQGAQKAAEALAIVDDELDIARIQTDTSIDYLRECINFEVEKAITDERDSLETSYNFAVAKGPEGSVAAARALQLRSKFDTDLNYNRDLFGAVVFYDPTVLQQLGWQDSYIDERADTAFLAPLLPAPTGTTTLAEALVVLSLTSNAHQQAILQRFNAGIKDRIAAALPQKYRSCKTYTDGGLAFANLNRFIGQDMGLEEIGLGLSGAGVTGFRHELVDELRANALLPIAEYVARTARAYGSVTKEITALKAEIAKVPKVPNRADLIDRAIADNVKQANYKHALETASPYLFGPTIKPDQLADLFSGRSEVELLGQLRQMRGRTAFEFDQSRQAAMDEALKKCLQSVDDDLQRQFVRPMLARLRERLILESHVGVGVIQTTSVLASNRLVAQVDPSASATLTPGSSVDALKETTQLLKLYAAVQTGGVTAVLGGLNSLSQAPPPAPEGKYGITSGNAFQVTPIFDPSGQAMRFRFDHVYSTVIANPDGTTDNQLSQIERHSVNTEVQLSNHEIRTISQFQANTRLGLPVRKTGGIPVLKDIPGLGDIPLIGWFTLHKGKAAEVQQSLVLAQTSMFPSVNELLGLLTHPIADGFDIQNTTPAVGAVP